MVTDRDLFRLIFGSLIRRETEPSGSFESSIYSSEFANSFCLKYRHQAHSILGYLRISVCYCFPVAPTTGHHSIDVIITMTSGFRAELNAADSHSHTS